MLLPVSDIVWFPYKDKQKPLDEFRAGGPYHKGKSHNQSWDGSKQDQRVKPQYTNNDENNNNVKENIENVFKCSVQLSVKS